MIDIGCTIESREPRAESRPFRRRGGTGRPGRLPAPASRDEAPCEREPRCPVRAQNDRHRAAGGDHGGRPAAGVRRGVPGPRPGAEHRSGLVHHDDGRRHHWRR